MPLTITTKVKNLDADTLLVCVDGSGRVPEDADDLKEFYNHLIASGKDETAPFNGKWGQILTVPMPEESNYTNVILVGVRADKKTKSCDWAALGAKMFAAIKATGTTSVFIPEHDKKSGVVGDALVRLVEGMAMASYEFTKHRAPKKDTEATKIKTIGVDTGADKKTESAILATLNVVAGTVLTRDVGNEPPNYLYPESFAKIIEKELKPLGIKVEIFDEKKLADMGAGGILGVGQGSARPPRMVIMTYNGAGAPKGKNAAGPIAIVGKGVTFDTGGIDIKPASAMEEMKYDMAGAAAVVGTMKALALNKVKVNVVGAVGLAENMPSHNAFRPADVLTSHAGKTVEVLNTDAEGRLVLMDVLSYVQKTHKPAEIVDLATLTGAIVVALGSTYAGAFVNNDKLWARLNAAGDETGEKLWRMPLHEDYRKAMEGGVSDLQNLSNWDRAGGSCTAAGFLEHFIENGTSWAHLDIAGTAWKKGTNSATAYGVRLLYKLIAG